MHEARHKICPSPLRFELRKEAIALSDHQLCSSYGTLSFALTRSGNLLIWRHVIIVIGCLDLTSRPHSFQSTQVTFTAQSKCRFLKVQFLFRLWYCLHDGPLFHPCFYFLPLSCFSIAWSVRKSAIVFFWSRNARQCEISVFLLRRCSRLHLIARLVGRLKVYA